MLIKNQWPEIPAPIDAAVFYQGTMSSVSLLLASVLLFYCLKYTLNKNTDSGRAEGSYIFLQSVLYLCHLIRSFETFKQM